MHKASSREEVASELKATGHRPVEHMYRIGALGAECLSQPHDRGRRFRGRHAGGDLPGLPNPPAALKLAKGTTQMSHFLKMREKGVTVCLGCDGSQSGDHKDMFRSMYLAATCPRMPRSIPKSLPPRRWSRWRPLPATARSLGRMSLVARAGQESGSHSDQHRPTRMGADLQLRLQPRVHRERGQRRYGDGRRQNPDGEPAAHHH